MQRLTAERTLLVLSIEQVEQPTEGLPELLLGHLSDACQTGADA
jgi:hypothetical protein